MRATVKPLLVVRFLAWWRSIPRRRKVWIGVFVASVVFFGSTVAFQGNQWLHSGLPWPDAYHSSLALDGFGHPHVALGTVDLRYETFSGAVWSSDLVDEGISVDSISTRLDSVGHVHIAYGARNFSRGYVTSDVNVKYATNAGGRWATSYIAYGASSPSIAVDSKGRIHLAYVSTGDFYDRNVSYRVLSGGIWSPRITLPGGGFEIGPITLDSSDHAYIPIGRMFPGYATNNHGSWEVVWLDSQMGTQSIPSLVVGSHEDLHMSYTAWSPSEKTRVLRYATNEAGSWTYSSVDRLENTNVDLAVIAQGPSGQLQIMYNDFRAAPDYSISTLKHAVQTQGGWSVSVISSNAVLQNPASFAIGPGNKAHVIYVQESQGSRSVVYATKGLDAFILATFLMENAFVLAVEVIVVGGALRKALHGRRGRPRVALRGKADH